MVCKAGSTHSLDPMPCLPGPAVYLPGRLNGAGISVVLLTFVLLIFCTAGRAQAGLIDDIKDRQKGLQSIKASFDQEKHTELLSRPVKSKGTVYFKANSGVRWEYDGAMTVIYDGKAVYINYTELDQADKVVGASDYLGPLTFDIATLVRDYQVAAMKSDRDITLDIKPKKRMPFVSMQMVFGPDDVFPRSITVNEESGDNTVIRFRDVLKNVSIKDSLFVFTAPKGGKVKERNFTQ